MDNNFNENIRRIRKEKGITQEQLADAVYPTDYQAVNSVTELRCFQRVLSRNMEPMMNL